jgi:hypothetical protein
MSETKITLAGLWIAVMLVFLLGDVMRVFAGHYEPGKMNGTQATQAMWLLASALMLMPILMMVMTLTLNHPAIKWANIVLAVFFVILNIAGLPYKGHYDNFLILVSFVFNGLTIWYAWKWIL